MINVIKIVDLFENSKQYIMEKQIQYQMGLYDFDYINKLLKRHTSNKNILVLENIQIRTRWVYGF